MMKTITIQYNRGSKNRFGGDMSGRVEEWAANREGEGLFSRKADGTWQQHMGTGDTPRFRTPADLRRYIRRAFEVRDARIIDTMGWSK